MENTIEQLKPLFTQMAEKIGQGAEFGWEVILKQQIAYGVICAIFTVIFLIAGIALIIYSIKSNDSIEENDLETVMVFTYLFIFGGFFIFCIQGILRLLNPEYYTLQFFMNLVQ